MSNYYICSDASVILRLFRPELDTRLQEQLASWQGDGYQLIAPALLLYEATNALYQYLKHGLLSVDTVQRAQDALLALPIRLETPEHLHHNALRIAGRFGLPATYDAYYLALAQQYNAVLWTSDRRLYNTVKTQLEWVHLWT